MEKPNKHNLDEDDIYEFIVNYGKKSVELETEREDNISKRCNAILTTISILLLPLFTIILELFKGYKKSYNIPIIICLILILILLFSLGCAIHSQWFYKKYYLNSVKDFELFVKRKSGNYTKEQKYFQQIDDYNKMFNDLLNSNNKRTKSAIIALCALYVFLILLFISVFMLLILFRR